jgi:hypothetical protein
MARAFSSLTCSAVITRFVEVSGFTGAGVVSLAGVLAFTALSVLRVGKSEHPALASASPAKQAKSRFIISSLECGCSSLGYSAR